MKVLKILLTLFHLGILVLLLATPLNSYISPEKLPFLNLLSLTFPLLMIFNIALCIFWILSRQKRVFVFLILSLFLILPSARWINWNSKSSEIPNLKIVTFNIKAGQMGRAKIYEYLKDSGADIVLAQEYGQEFNVPTYTYRSAVNSVVSINSKTEILQIQNLNIPGNGNAIYADIKINGKIIRVFNIYLNPFSFDKQKLKPSENFEKNEGKFKYAIRRLVPTFKIHQREINIIRKAIDASPYPVIIAGDFNSVPNSYEYYTLGKDLTDAFFEAGSGSATSFHDYKFPIRIDYIFASKEILPVSYRVDRAVKMSDHFPVIAEFKVD